MQGSDALIPATVVAKLEQTWEAPPGVWGESLATGSRRSPESVGNILNGLHRPTTPICPPVPFPPAPPSLRGSSGHTTLSSSPALTPEEMEWASAVPKSNQQGG